MAISGAGRAGGCAAGLFGAAGLPCEPLGSRPPGGTAIRKQYHFRPSPRGLLAWDVQRLVELSAGFPRRRVPLAAIRQIDEPCWHGPDDPAPTCRNILEHARLIMTADLGYPIILSADGGVMDGMHRVLKALMQEREVIDAVRFEEDPAPDFVGLGPAELPY